LSLLAQVEASLMALPCPKAGLSHPHHEDGFQKIKLLAQNAWCITYMAGPGSIVSQVIEIGKLQIANSAMGQSKYLALGQVVSCLPRQLAPIVPYLAPRRKRTRRRTRIDRMPDLRYND
jgi:hypothetical protein